MIVARPQLAYISLPAAGRYGSWNCCTLQEFSSSRTASCPARPSGRQAGPWCAAGCQFDDPPPALSIIADVCILSVRTLYYTAETNRTTHGDDTMTFDGI